MYKALDVAKWFICHNRVMMDSGGAEYISNLKLQKLLYYAQGAFLAVKGSPLFDDPIEAWTHGPVVPTVYHEFKHYGDAGIEVPTGFDPDIIADSDAELLLEVYEEFGQYSAWKLRNMTHEETPWKSTKLGQIIDTDLIRDYFTEHYVA